MSVVLEGGYSLEALEVSSEAVVKTLFTKDSDEFESLLIELGV